MEDVRPPLPGGQRRFLDTARQRIRDNGLSYATEKTYLHWTRRFIRYHGFRRREDMKPADIEAYLSHLAGPLRCASNTQRTALNALVFLYQKHLGIEVGTLSIRYAKRGRRMPTVFSHDEALAVIAALDGAHRLVGQLMYGSGLRVNEALRLRVKDIDFAQQQIAVRDGKGMHDRLTLLPASLTTDIYEQIARVRDLLAFDKASGNACVHLPDALARKYPQAGSSLGWQFLFPARELSVDPYDGTRRRHHLHYSGMQRAMKRALTKTGFTRKASTHTFRHSFATRLIETGYDIKLVQSLLGHRDIRTTEIYLHVVRNRAGAIVSPVDNVARSQSSAGSGRR